MRPIENKFPLLACAVAALAAIALDWLLAPGGAGTGDWFLFLGRFHPLVVHLPIGLLLLLGVFEVLTGKQKLRERLDPAISVILPLAIGAALAAFVLGHLLSAEGDWAKERVLLHRQLALATVLLSSTAGFVWFLHWEARAKAWRHAYRGSLIATLGALSVGAHFGGTLSRGEHYLAYYAPEVLAPLLGGKPEPPPPPPKKKAKKGEDALMFQHAVHPVLHEYCVECHGAKKDKGGLRLDSFGALMEGGDSGAAIEPGKPNESLLVQRMRLPLDDDDHMPPEDEEQPSAAEIELVELWIARGAEQETKIRDLYIAPEIAQLLQDSLREPKAAPDQAVSNGKKDESATEKAGPPPDEEEESGTSGQFPAPTSETDSAGDGASDPASSDAAPVGPTDPRAILMTYCADCHGADKQKAKLRVDSKQGLLRGGKKGAAIVPGAPNDSRLIRRMRLPLQHDDHMPPPKKDQPSARQTTILANWIAAMGGQSRGTGEEKKLAQGSDETDTAEDSGSVAGWQEEDPPASSQIPTEEDSAPSEARVRLHRQAGQVDLWSGVTAIFSDKCITCHDSMLAQGKLNLETYAAMMEGGETGRVIEPGSPEDSLLYERITLPGDHEDHMPPSDHEDLAESEVALIGLWIEQGAQRPARIAFGDLPQRVARLVGPMKGADGKSGATLEKQEQRPAEERKGKEPPPVERKSSGWGLCGAAPPLHGTRSALFWLSLSLLAALTVRRRQSC